MVADGTDRLAWLTERLDFPDFSLELNPGMADLTSSMDTSWAISVCNTTALCKVDVISWNARKVVNRSVDIDFLVKIEFLVKNKHT